MSDILIRCDRLHKTYGQGAAASHALRGVTATIPRGAFAAIVGPSGHGKSTLMHLIGGLDRPTSGSLQVAGAELAALSATELARFRARTIGFVFQFFNLLPHLSAAENVETALLFGGGAGKATAARARESLDRVGLADKSASRPGQLSGGQQQRVAIARALANDPPLLLLDEPTGNLDSVAEGEIVALLKALNAEGRTVVLVTHNRDIAAQADCLLTIRDGVVVGGEQG